MLILPDYDSTVTRKLRRAGAIIVVNNTHEFACGITNINPHYGPSKNPWDLLGCSGGSMGFSCSGRSRCLWRQLARIQRLYTCVVLTSGIFGLKPTYGRVSKYGVMPLAPSIDHLGPLARSAWDMLQAFQVIAGYDKLDPSSVKVPIPDYLKEISSSYRRRNTSNDRSKKFKIGIQSNSSLI